MLQLSVPISALGRDGDRTGVKTLVILYPGVNSLECEIFPSFVKIPEELFFSFIIKTNPTFIPTFPLLFLAVSVLAAVDGLWFFSYHDDF